MHNVVNHYLPELMTHKNCFDYFEFENFLINKENKFIDLKKGIIENDGQVLTIDDATNGAYNAAMLCANNKHKVTLFINPFYIVHNKNYFMHYLSCFIDYIEKETIIFDNIEYDLTTHKGRKILRKIVKLKLQKIPSENDRILLLEKTFNKRTQDITLPYHLRTMSSKQLDNLVKNKYVRIEYHGWTHSCLSAMTREQIKKDIQISRKWHKMNFDKDFIYFAIPFGSRYEDIDKDFDAIFLEDNTLSDASLPENVYNRIPLNI
jgi:uncharacterized Fe-S cluster-containing radical SAM superfamily protein